MYQEAGAEGKLCLATLLQVLLSLPGSGDLDNNFDVIESLLVCISYHREVFDVFTNWSLNSPVVSAFLDGYPSAVVMFSFSSFLHSQSSAGNLIDSFPVAWAQEPAKGLLSCEEDKLSK